MGTNKALRWKSIVFATVLVVGCSCGGSFIDNRDSQKYRTVKIGNRIVWMAENLNYKIENSWCYNNEELNCEKYGRLYDWEAAKVVCPRGWHLPERWEWDELVRVAGGRSIAGKKLKSTSGWHGDGNGSDDYGFSALPGGYRYHPTTGDFKDAGLNGYWWSASEFGADYAYHRNIYYSGHGDSMGNYVYERYYFKSFGFSVRCVRRFDLLDRF